MNPAIRNALRWAGALAVAVVWGGVTAMTDGNPSWNDIMRHGLLAAVPTILALKLTLEKSLGIGDK